MLNKWPTVWTQAFTTEMKMKNIFSCSLELFVWVEIVFLPQVSSLACYKCSLSENINCGLTLYNLSITTNPGCEHGCEAVVTYAKVGRMATSVVRKCAGQFTKTECTAGPENHQIMCTYFCKTDNCNGGSIPPLGASKMSRNLKLNSPMESTPAQANASSTNLQDNVANPDNALAAVPAETDVMGFNISQSQNSTANEFNVTFPAEGLNFTTVFNQSLTTMIPGTPTVSTTVQCYQCDGSANSYCGVEGFNGSEVNTTKCYSGSCATTAIYYSDNPNEVASVSRGCYVPDVRKGCENWGDFENCTTVCSSNFCNGEASNTTLVTPQADHIICYLCDGNQGSIACGPTISNPAVETCYTGKCATTIAYSSNDHLTYFYRSCAPVDMRNGCSYESNGTFVCFDVCTSSYCNADIPSYLISCLTCDSVDDNDKCITMNEYIPTEECRFGSCLSITIFDEDSSTPISVERTCGIYPESTQGCFSKNGTTICLAQCTEDYCFPDVDYTASIRTENPEYSIQCYLCEGDEHSACGISSSFNNELIDSETCNNKTCITTVVYDGSSLPVFARSCSRDNRRSGCITDTDGFLKCSTVCNKNYCNGVVPATPITCYACDSLSVYGCNEMVSCSSGSCLTVAVTDEVTREVTAVQRSCAGLRITSSGCFFNDGQYTCVSYCTEELCNSAPASPTSLVRCYECEGPEDSDCGLGNFNSEEVREVTCHQGSCATTVILENPNIYPSFTGMSVSRGCALPDTKVGCQGRYKEYEICIEKCDSDLCNGVPVAPPGIHCYLCTGTGDSSCGTDFTLASVGITTCSTGACSILTISIESYELISVTRGCYVPGTYTGCQQAYGYEFCYSTCSTSLCNRGTIDFGTQISMWLTNAITPSPVLCYQCSGSLDSKCWTDSAEVSTSLYCTTGSCVATVSYNAYSKSNQEVTRSCASSGETSGCTSYPNGDTACTLVCSYSNCNDGSVQIPKSTTTTTTPLPLRCYSCSGARGSACWTGSSENQQMIQVTCAWSCQTSTITYLNGQSSPTVTRGCGAQEYPLNMNPNSNEECTDYNLSYTECVTACNTNLCNDENENLVYSGGREVRAVWSFISLTVFALVVNFLI